MILNYYKLTNHSIKIRSAASKKITLIFKGEKKKFNNNLQMGYKEREVEGIKIVRCN